MIVWNNQWSSDLAVKKTFAVLGAFDRFNYGDLLFPILIRKEFEYLEGKYDFKYYSLMGGDLRNLGGIASDPLRKLQNTEMAKGSVLLVAGGDVLSALWHHMHASLVSKPFSLAYSILRKATSGRMIVDRVLARKYGVTGLLPWVQDWKREHPDATVIYNSVSGSSLKMLSADMKQILKTNLAASDYVSVRDSDTKRELDRLGGGNEIHLVPDSAVLMSDLYSLQDLEDSASEAARSACNDYPAGTLCFQVNGSFGTANASVIAEQLDDISSELGLHLVLLPIGTARAHNDQDALRMISGKLKRPHLLLNDPTVMDIMYVIARSRLFIGSSLHGCLTAISFSVPHVGLTERVPKLSAFLADWDLGEMKQGSRIEHLSASAMKAYAVRKKLLDERAVHLKHLVRVHYSALKQLIE